MNIHPSRLLVHYHGFTLNDPITGFCRFKANCNLHQEGFQCKLMQKIKFPRFFFYAISRYGPLNG